jgi:GNAT superfamily N-acetyltransferase
MGEMRVDLGNGYELDDDPGRVDVDAVHAYLSLESYWARGRPRPVTQALLRGAARLVGLYRDDVLVGFSRTVSDGHVHSYLADVYVLEAHRGRGLGRALVRFTVEQGPLAATRWLLHTRDAHALYEEVGFGSPGDRLMERRGSPPAGAAGGST